MLSRSSLGHEVHHPAPVDAGGVAEAGDLVGEGDLRGVEGVARVLHGLGLRTGHGVDRGLEEVEERRDRARRRARRSAPITVSGGSKKSSTAVDSRRNSGQYATPKSSPAVRPLVASRIGVSSCSTVFGSMVLRNTTTCSLFHRPQRPPISSATRSTWPTSMLPLERDGRPHAHERQVGAVERLGQIGGGPQAARRHVVGDELVEPRLDHGPAAVVQRCDLARVAVDPDDGGARLREAGGRDRSDISESNDGDLHGTTVGTVGGDPAVVVTPKGQRPPSSASGSATRVEQQPEAVRVADGLRAVAHVELREEPALQVLDGLRRDAECARAVCFTDSPRSIEWRIWCSRGVRSSPEAMRGPALAGAARAAPAVGPAARRRRRRPPADTCATTSSVAVCRAHDRIGSAEQQRRSPRRRSAAGR